MKENNKGKTYDFRSGKTIPEGSDIVEGATYAGHVHEHVSKQIQIGMFMITDRNKHLSVLIQSWNRDKDLLEEQIKQIVHSLGSKDYDPSTHDIVISKEGHIWYKERDSQSKPS